MGTRYWGNKVAGGGPCHGEAASHRRAEAGWEQEEVGGIDADTGFHGHLRRTGWTWGHTRDRGCCPPDVSGEDERMPTGQGTGGCALVSWGINGGEARGLTETRGGAA